MLQLLQSIRFCLFRLGWAATLLQVWNISIAQSSYPNFEYLTSDDGLSSDKVESILQDHDGFYWIATQNGMNRFDGTNFKVFRHNTSDSTSLSHNYCTAMVEGRDGDIWVATYKGVSRFQKSKGTFKRIYLHHPSRNFEITNRIHNLAVDPDGNIWIAGNGFWKYDVQQDSIILFTNDPSDPASIPRYSQITQLISDRMLNGLWFISGDELIFYSSTKKQFFHKKNNPMGWKVFDLADSRELALDKKNRLWFRDRESQVLSYFESESNRVTLSTKKVTQGIRQLCVDDQGRIWIFYWLVGAEIYDPETSTTETGFFTAHHSRSAISELGTYLFIDDQKNHWIASGKGISIYQEANQYYTVHRLSVNESAPGKEPVKINAMAQNKDNRLWIATNLGLYQYDLNTGIARYVKINLPLKTVNTICVDNENLWFAIHDRLICMNTKSESVIKNIFINPGIFFLRKGNKHDLWIGLWTGGLYHLDLNTNQVVSFLKGDDILSSIKSNNLITGMPDENIFWVGYNGGMGFSSYSTDTGLWAHYHPQENDLSNSNAGTITVITKDDNGTIWLGTHGSGVFHFDPGHNTFKNYQQQNGLNSNYINSILTDREGNLWISTADGLNFMRSDSKNILPLDAGLVFPDNDFAANGIEGIGGKMYFFCKNEFVEINPEAYHSELDFPKIVISNFKVFDHEIPIPDPNDEINLSYKQNFFSFEFSSIKTQPHREVNYTYMLEGFDKEWNADEHKQTAAYTNVPDGHYTFKVKATNSDGLWSDDLLNIRISIRPPFWRTWWFISLALFFMIYIAYAFHRYRIGQVKKIYSVRTQISRDLHDDIGASLSSINIYSNVAETEVDDNPERAKEIMSQISSNSRQVMENISDIVWANHVNRLESASLAGRIKNYGYELLSQKNIECDYQIDPNVERRLSSPDARKNILLIIKEALNNITKYSEATKVDLHIYANAANLNIQITDNGKGFDVNTIVKGNGLLNMEQRAMALGGNMNIQTSPGKGTTIETKIPLANISD